jgi:hypothetical protein
MPNRGLAGGQAKGGISFPNAIKKSSFLKKRTKKLLSIALGTPS